MSSQDIERWFTQAAAIAAKVPKNLQEAAFHRALDHLMGAPSASPAARNTSSEGRRRSSSADGYEEKLVAKIDRTRHPDVGATSRLADRALKVLELALAYGVDGLTAGETAEILTKTFRLPAKPNAVAMALARERTTADLRRNNGKAVFHITQPGEEYLKKLREADNDAHDDVVQRAGRSRASRSRISHARPAVRGATERDRNKEEASVAPQKRGRSGRIGPKAAIEKLIAGGFFGSPRTISHVRDELKHRLGFDFALQELSVSLVRLLRAGDLRRQRSEKNQYEYRT